MDCITIEEATICWLNGFKRAAKAANDINMSHARFEDPCATIPNYHAAAPSSSASSKATKRDALKAAQQKWLHANTGVSHPASTSVSARGADDSAYGPLAGAVVEHEHVGEDAEHSLVSDDMTVEDIERVVAKEVPYSDALPVVPTSSGTSGSTNGAGESASGKGALLIAHLWKVVPCSALTSTVCWRECARIGSPQAIALFGSKV